MFHFTVLASGSSGNASLIESPTFGLLLDSGLGPRKFDNRLKEIDRSWESIDAVLLTHTHGDHWNDRTLDRFLKHGIRFYCHERHVKSAPRFRDAVVRVAEAGLLYYFEPHERLEFTPNLSVLPFPVRHDSGATFGFRIEGSTDLFGDAPTLAYACDLGCWDKTTVEHLLDADVLAVEFNHDVELEARSGRRPHLIARVLGDQGHLSNVQAAALTQAVLERSAPGRLRHVVQLHLSGQCNRPALAREAVRDILDEFAPEANLHTARQDVPTERLEVSPLPEAQRPKRKARKRPPMTRRPVQGWLFGPDEEFG